MLGIELAEVVHVVAVALGLSALLAASQHALDVVRYAGAAYLIVLGVRRWREGAAEIESAGETASPRRILVQGFVVQLFNPKVAIFFLALLPQFIDADAPQKLLAFVFLGAWFVVQGGAFLVAFALLVAPLRRWRASASLRRGLQLAGAGLFAWLAARLALVERV